MTEAGVGAAKLGAASPGIPAPVPRAWEGNGDVLGSGLCAGALVRALEGTGRAGAWAEAKPGTLTGGLRHHSTFRQVHTTRLFELF